MKFIKKIWREALLCLFLGSFVYLMYIFATARPEGSTAQSLMVLGILASAAVSVLLIYSLWRAKWKQAAAKALQKIFVKLQRFFDRMAIRLGFSRKKTVLRGKTTVIFDKYDRKSHEEESQQRKPPKWKQISDDRGRMRYLYRQMVTGKIKKGAFICAADTPIEVKNAESKSLSEESLFDLYIAYRYDDRSVPDGEQIKRIKEELELK